MKFFSDAENLMPHPQGYASHHNETVPNCMGNESRLSDCPTEDPPTRCDELCAKVNCIPAKTPPVGLLTQIVSAKTQAVLPSLTSSQRAVIASLAHPQCQTNTLSAIETPQAMRKGATSGERSDSIFYKLIGVVIMVVVVAGTIVSVCLIVRKGRCHHIPKSGSLPIVTGYNVACVEPKRPMEQHHNDII